MSNSQPPDADAGQPRAIPFPIPREEARLDVAHARKTIARLGRRKAALAGQIAEVDEQVEDVRRMLRTIFGVYPDLDEEEAPRKPLADLFGSDPDFTGGMDSVAYVRQGRGEV